MAPSSPLSAEFPVLPAGLSSPTQLLITEQAVPAYPGLTPRAWYQTSGQPAASSHLTPTL